MVCISYAFVRGAAFEARLSERFLRANRAKRLSPEGNFLIHCPLDACAITCTKLMSVDYLHVVDDMMCVFPSPIMNRNGEGEWEEVSET